MTLSLYLSAGALMLGCVPDEPAPGLGGGHDAVLSGQQAPAGVAPADGSAAAAGGAPNPEAGAPADVEPLDETVVCTELTIEGNGTAAQDDALERSFAMPADTIVLVVTAGWDNDKLSLQMDMGAGEAAVEGSAVMSQVGAGELEIRLDIAQVDPGAASFVTGERWYIKLANTDDGGLPAVSLSGQACKPAEGAPAAGEADLDVHVEPEATPGDLGEPAPPPDPDAADGPPDPAAAAAL